MTAVDVTLVSPLPAGWYQPLWTWLLEDRVRNFDDDGPQDFGAFANELLQRQRAGERSWGIAVDGDPMGAIGYRPLTARLGSLHGICVTRSACGTGIARQALYLVLDELFASGVEKIVASYFADNERVHRFLQRAGFVEEGYLIDHTRRDGHLIDLRLVALFTPAAEEGV